MPVTVAFPKRPYACIFDVDDTLISNYYPDGKGLHELSRHEAIQIIGKRRNLQALVDITAKDNHDIVYVAPYHTMESITWTLLSEKGIVASGELDHDHELLVEIVNLKNEIYHERLVKDGKEIPGAANFLRYLKNINTKLAIASGATMRDIETDLKIIGVSDLFEPQNIKAKGSYITPKPHPDPFVAAIEALGLTDTQVQNTWAFEDDINGIHSAQDAGLKVCAITSRFTEEQLLPHLNNQGVVVQDYDDLMQRIGV